MRLTTGGNLGIGTIAPTTKLHIFATQSYTGFRLVDTSEGLNKILTSDASGNSSWTASSAVLASANGVTGSGTTNYVPYWKSSNNLSATSSIFIDPTSGNVLIGTSSNNGFTLDVQNISGTTTLARLKGGSLGSAYYGTKNSNATTLYALGDSAAVIGAVAGVSTGASDVLSTLYSTVDMNFFIGSSEAMRINANSI